MKAGLYHKLKRTVRFQHTLMERFLAITDLSKMIFSRKDSLGWHFPRRSRRNEKEHTGKSRVTCSCVTVTNCATHIWAESTPLEICLRLLIRGRLSQWRKLYPRLRTWHICHLFLFLVEGRTSYLHFHWKIHSLGRCWTSFIELSVLLDNGSEMNRRNWWWVDIGSCSHVLF